MRVLVTGAAGCLGNYVANALARQGLDVFAIYRNRRPLSIDSRVHIVQADLSKAHGLPARYDAVFHAAAVSPAPKVTAANMALNNIEATRQLVSRSREAGARYFIFCSSLSIHGNITVDEVDENTPICSPDVYGLTKLVGEALVAETAPDLASLSLRLPAVLGPGASRNFLAAAAAKLHAGEPIVIFNPEAKFNNAVHCADIADLVLSILQSPRRGFEPLVLGAAGSITVNDTIERLRRKIGSRSPIVIGDPPKPAFLLRSSRAAQHFGYSPMEIGAMLDRFADETINS
jgi:nucleoside-diphosphate-sugar epimerase